MPISPQIGAAAIGAGGSLIGGLLSARQSKKNRQFQYEQNYRDTQHEWDMYWRQREDALNDYNMQNAYNSPIQQMQRLREAGLNPHMMYGQGAQNTGSMVRSVAPSPRSKPAPRINEGILPEMVNNIFRNINELFMGRQIQAQTDNLRAQHELTNAQIISEIVKGERGKFDLDLAKRTREIDIATKREELANIMMDTSKKGSDIVVNEAQVNKIKADIAKIDVEIDKLFAETKNIIQATKKLEADTGKTLKETEIMELMKTPNLSLAIQELMLKRSQSIKTDEEIKLIMEKLGQEQFETLIKEIEYKLRQDGVSPSDPYYYRLLYTLILKTLKITTIVK